MDHRPGQRQGPRTTASPGLGTGSVCPIKIEDEKFPPGVYRLVGHVQIGDEAGYYKTPTFEKPEG